MIFVFFSFSELMLGYAVFNTVGWVQAALTTFVIAFPTVCAGAFFYFLWHRPEHLYAPRDFSTDTAYLQSMSEARKGREGLPNIEHSIRQVVLKELTSDRLAAELQKATTSDIPSILGRAAEELSNRIKTKQFFTITFEQFDESIPPMTVPIDAYPTIKQLMDDVYFVLSPRVRPHYYGIDWLMRDRDTGKIVKTRRLLNRTPPGLPAPDKRPLSAVGVEPGVVLQVFRPATADERLASPD
jgi:hypothetical protein